MAERRLFTWKGVVVGLLVLVLAGVAYIGYGILHVVNVVIPHSYAAWDTGNLMVEYLETHDGRWPRGWGDLREADASLRRKGKNIYWGFDRLPAIVRIDWSADPETLARLVLSNRNYQLKVVTQPDGSRLEANWGEDTEPNAKIRRYLIKRYSASAPQEVVNGERIIKALARYAKDASKRGETPPSSVTLSALAQSGYLTPEEVKPFEGAKVTFYANATETTPGSVLCAVQMPDGTVQAALADGSVQGFTQSRWQQYLTTLGQPSGQTTGRQPSHSETDQAPVHGAK